MLIIHAILAAIAIAALALRPRSAAATLVALAAAAADLALGAALAPALAVVVHMRVPGTAAAALGAAGIALPERRALAPRIATAQRDRSPLSAAERHAVLSLAGAALAAWVAPLAGIAPWWPFTAAVALGLIAKRARPRLVVPWRVAGQVGALVVATGALDLSVAAPPQLALPGLLLVASAVAAASAL